MSLPPTFPPPPPFSALCPEYWLTSHTVGVTFVDYEHDQKRYPKKSAKSLEALFASLIEK